MQGSDIVDRYLASSYCTIEQKPAFEDEYATYIESIASSFLDYARSRQLLSIDPKLRVVIIYALDKTSSAVALGELVTVVQNRFFIQSLNNLNKIMFGEIGILPVGLPMFAYLFRLMREQAYVEGYPEYSAFVDVFRKQSKDLQGIEMLWKNPSNLDHLPLTEIQEAFVVAHELAHLTIGPSATQYKFVGNNLRTGWISTLLSQTHKKSPDLELLDSVLDCDSALQEELVCDQISFDFLLHYFSGKYEVEVLFGAVRMFYMHMRALEICKNAFLQCRLIIGTEVAGEAAALPRMDRNWARGLHSDLLQSGHGERAHQILTKWNAWMDLHHMRISDPTFKAIRRSGTRLWTGPLSFDVATRTFNVSKAEQ